MHIIDLHTGILEEYHGTLKDKIKARIQDVLATQLREYYDFAYYNFDDC